MTPPLKNLLSHATMSDTPPYISIALPTPLRKTFQYRCTDKVSIGSRVQVPFGNRVLTGVVLGFDEAPALQVSKIKSVIKVLDALPAIPETILNLCLRTARYYDHPIGEVFATALPTLIRQGKDPETTPALLFLTPAGAGLAPETLTRAPARKQLISHLQRRISRSRQQLNQAGIKAHTIKAVIDQGWAEWRDSPALKADTTTDPVPATGFSSSSAEGYLSHVNYQDIEPTPEQQNAIARIEADGTSLLHGITGSGKTEIYLRIIEQHLRAGRQALILVPEIGLTPQIVARFSERFQAPVTVLHSGLTDRARALAWLDARSGRAAIVLGTRSAIFTPLKQPGIIIVDEEHDGSFKQQDGCRYSARDLAVLRGSIESTPVILGSATPSLESLHNAEQGKYTLVHLMQRVPGAQAESYQLIDTSQVEVTEGFSKPLMEQIGRRLSKGEQVLVFINRRGFAPVIFCNQCRWIARCRHCDARLTYHLPRRILVCHHCGYQARDITHCQSCQSGDVAALGMGTQRIEHTLEQAFPQVPVIRVDRDSTRRKGAMADFISQVSKGDAGILVGTQLLAKGHHFPKVTLVAILDVDAGFFSADFKSLEKLGQLILQVGGRAGRAGQRGKVVIQTRFAHHPLLQTLIKDGYTEFATKILAERKALALPPYSFHTLIRAESRDPALARSFLEQVAETPAATSVNVLGPIPALMEKKAGRYRQLLLLASSHRARLHDDLARRVERAAGLPLAKKVRWAVDVDPADTF